jgi:hypothetical protein
MKLSISNIDGNVVIKDVETGNILTDFNYVVWEHEDGQPERLLLGLKPSSLDKVEIVVDNVDIK